MAAKDDINRVFREFNRYTGDGKPGAPSNAPLPVGDPSSGAHSPKKVEIRQALGGLADEVVAAVEHVEEIAGEIAAGAVPDGAVTDPKVAPNAGISATKIAYSPGGTGSVARPVATVLEDWSNNVMGKGAVGNGTTNDAVAFNRALADFAGKEIFIPPGRNFRIDGSLNHIPANTTIRGHKSKSRITRYGSGDLFTIANSYTTIENLYLDDTNVTAGTDIVFATASKRIDNTHIRDITTESSRGFIKDTADSINGITVLTWIERCLMTRHRGPGIDLKRAYAFTYLTHCTVDFVNAVGNDNSYTGFNLLGSNQPGAAGGVVFTDCIVLGTSQTTTSPNQNGFIIQYCMAVDLVGCHADTCDGYGFYLNEVEIVVAERSLAGLCNKHGWELNGVRDFRGTDIKGRGRNDPVITVKAANQDAFRINAGCLKINLVNPVFDRATGYGLARTAPVSGITVTGGNIWDNTRRGVIADGIGSLLMVGTSFNGNGEGNYAITSPYDHILNCQAANGTLINISGTGSGYTTG